MLGRPPTTLRGRALAWLSQREHSRSELRTKLCRWMAKLDDAAAESTLRDGAAASAGDAIERLLDELEAAGHLSDTRFVDSRVHSREARFGNWRIEQELRQHGLTLDDCTRVDLRASEAQRASSVRAAKFGSLPSTTPDRARQTRFLAARGFSSEAIRSALRGEPDDT